MTFNEITKKHHEILNTTNKCYILCCGQNTEVIIKWKRTSEIHFYCNRCAAELITEFPNLFEKVHVK